MGAKWIVASRLGLSKRLTVRQTPDQQVCPQAGDWTPAGCGGVSGVPAMVQALANNPLVIGSKMIERLVTACLVLVAFCFSSPGNSQEIYTFGVGGDSCVSYISHVTTSPGKLVSRTALDDRQDLQSTIYREWLLGFISGYNATLNDPTERVQVDVAAVELYVRWWCVQNRASNMATAVQRFLNRADP
jgi:hypothetical protein